MMSVRRVVGPLRILLVVAFAALVACQTVVVPHALQVMTEKSPDLAYLRGPVLACTVGELLCVQVVIACTWRLLALVTDDQIFTDRSLAWVDAIVWAIAAAWLLLLGDFLYFLVAWGLSGLPALLLVLLLAGAVLGLLMLVMRELLRQATTLRTDMEAVI